MRQRLCMLVDLPDGKMKSIQIQSHVLAVIRQDKTVYAVSDVCSHAHCSLGTDGFLDGTVISCGCHGAQFDAATGTVLSLPATVPLATYPVSIENGVVYVDIA